MSSPHRNYIPQNAAQFNAFMRNLMQYVEAKTGGANAARSNIPQERVTLLQNSYRQFEEAFNLALETPTHANTLRRQEAQTAAVSYSPVMC